MSISDKIQEAREWSRCIEQLKASVDSMYEICRIQQNILGCEEAIMFLKNGIRDFLSLIDTIKIEQNWENSEKRPLTALAWEIRGSAVSRCGATKEKQCQIPVAAKFVEVEEMPKEKEVKREESEWKVVQRKKGNGRNSMPASTSISEGNPNPLPTFSKFSRKAPKSAMDLPQTKASMAKMAYSRQLLFEKHKKTLLEKFNSRRRRAEKTEKPKLGEETAKKEMPERRPRIILAEEERKSLEKDEQMVDCLKTLIDQLSDDCEWRAMTEEEESLAQEEASLKKEIEEEEEVELSPFEDTDNDGEEGAMDEGRKEEEPKLGKNNEGERAVGSGPPLEKKEENGGTGPGCPGAHYRNPGELAQLRAKLLSPIKRRRTEDIDHQSSENKLRRAEELRTTLGKEKAQRLHLLHERVEEVRSKREQIQQKKMAHLEMVKERVQKAEQNRQKNLEEIVQKAQEDEMKIMEINLLNSFEAANQRLEKRFGQIRERNRYEKMIQKTEEDRQRRIDENRQQREEAEKRRKDAEEQRTQRLMDEANQHQERQCHALKHRTKALEKYRVKVAQHSQRIFQRKSREQSDKQKLLDKIQKKQEKRTENYEQCKEQVRRRANELSSPRPGHFWAQTMTDFSQLPADLSLQQRPIVMIENADRVAEEHGEGGEEVEMAKSSTSINGTQMNCFRCRTKLFSDVHLLSHILSDEHLANAGKKVEANMHSSAICYDFLRNELEKMAATVNVEDSPTELELMTKSAEDSSLGINLPMEQIIAKNAEMLISDPELLRLLKVEELDAGKAKISSGAKKKRTKTRQKFVREFEHLNQQKEQINSNETNIRKDKLVEALLKKIRKCGEKLEGEELMAVDRGLIEMLKSVQSNSKAHEQTLVQKAVRDSDLIEKLLALNIRIHHKRLTKDGLGPRILIKSFSLLNSIMAFGSVVDGMALLHLCELFQLNVTHAFVVTASGTDQPPSPPSPPSSPSLSFSFSILHLFSLLFPRLPSSTVRLLFSYLCSCCSLLEFISLIGRRLEGTDLLGSVPGGDQELCKAMGSACEVITEFVTSLIENVGRRGEVKGSEEAKEEKNEGELRESAKKLARNDSVESQGTAGGSCASSTTTTNGQQIHHTQRLRQCAAVWLYCLALHSYHHFRQLGSQLACASMESSSCTLLPSSSAPSSPSKGEQNPGTASSLVLSKCILRQFCAIAEMATPSGDDDQNGTNDQSLLQYFMGIESERTMTVRITGVLRSILHLAIKGMNNNSQKQNASGKKDAGKDQQQQQQKQEMINLAEQCIRTIGYFAAYDPRNRLLCMLGWQRSLLSVLCSASLPLEFVHSAPLKHALLPTLIIILSHSQIGVGQIRGEFCLHYLIDYLKNAIQSKESKNADEFMKQFPFLQLLEPSSDRWALAREFFESATMNSSE